MQPFSQCNPLWAGHPLGWYKPGTICQYGCYNTVFAMIANASGHPCTPASLDDLFTAKKIFVQDSTGTFDLLPDNALDLAFPGDYSTQHFDGFRGDLIRAAIPTPNIFVALWVHGYSPLWKMNIVTHFLLGWSADGQYVMDPEGGVVRPLSAYGGPGNVHKTSLITHNVAKPVAAPKPPPATQPAPVVPVPLYGIRVAGVMLATGLTYEAAQQRAYAAAHAKPGTLYELIDDKGKVVETEYAAPPPSPVPAKPAPLPTPLPTPTNDIWGAIQRVIIALVLALRRIPVQA